MQEQKKYYRNLLNDSLFTFGIEKCLDWVGMLKHKAQDIIFKVFLPKMLNIFIKLEQNFRSKLQVTRSRTVSVLSRFSRV